MKKGMIIIATQSHLYGRMAYNLAVTIKATGTSIPICLICDKQAIAHLGPGQIKMFDQLVFTDLTWNEIRFSIDQLSPFDQNIQLDADLLWLWKDPEELFAQASHVPWLVTNYGSFDAVTGREKVTGDYLWWADIKKASAAYGLKGKIYQACFEMSIWKKGVIARSILSAAKTIRNNPLVGVKLFEGAVCDEFCLNIATAQAGVMMASPWLPVKRARNVRYKTVKQLNEELYAVSFAGNRAAEEEIRLYDTIIQAACYKLGLKHLFKLQSKKEHLITRKSI